MSAEKQLRVSLVRSYHTASRMHQKVLDGLGLKKQRQTRELEDTPAIRGMIAKVDHLVVVEKA